MSNFEELNGAIKVFCQAGEMRRHKLVQAIIAEKKEPTAYQALTQDLEISQGMISRYVKRLTAEGLLLKKYQQNNKKSVYLEITPSGQLVADIHREMHQREATYYADLLKDVSDADLEAAIKLLKMLS